MTPLRQQINLAAGQELFPVLPPLRPVRRNPEPGGGSRGPTRDALRIWNFLTHVFDENFETQKAKQGPGTPVCIWGKPGLGKTDLVRAYAKERKWKFAYCAPAQFEEMGDFHGIPVVQGGRTVYQTPQWVPTEPGPGILLFDDFNRADTRILGGLMQLFQTGALMSWPLPPLWNIVCTANPDTGDYAVKPLDAAMHRRLLHMTMRFDVTAWARWALASGIDQRGVSFVLTYPDLIETGLTNPGSLVQFFTMIKRIPDLKKQLDLVTDLSLSALDEVTAATFSSFISHGMEQLISPEEILDAPSFAPVGKRLAEIVKGGKGTTTKSVARVDMINVIRTRLYLFLTSPNYKSKPKHGANLRAFLAHESVPGDIRADLHAEIMANASPAVKKMLQESGFGAASFEDL